MFGPTSLVANAKNYRKTPMQALLDRGHIDSLRPFMKLPPNVNQAKPMLMMFIEHNPQPQHASPETVLNNVVQFAIAYQQLSGKQLNLTMDQDEAIPMPSPNEDEKKLAKSEKPISILTIMKCLLKTGIVSQHHRAQAKHQKQQRLPKNL
jgi:hypothetical protein